MGNLTSKLDKNDIPEGEHYFGLENLGNTCYCNSVLQCLYFCYPLRSFILDYARKLQNKESTEDNLLTSLADLFFQIDNQKKKVGVMTPKRFISNLRSSFSHKFEGTQQHDAHEFLIDLLNGISEIIEEEQKNEQLQLQKYQQKQQQQQQYQQQQQQQQQQQYQQQQQQLQQLSKQSLIKSENAAQEQAGPHLYDSYDNSSSSGTPTNKVTQIDNNYAKQLSNGSSQYLNGQNNLQSNGYKESLKAWSLGIPPRPSEIASKQLKSKKPPTLQQQQLLQQYQTSLQQQYQTKNQYYKNNQETHIQQIFEGKLVNETRCLYCDSVSLKEQPFKEIPLAIQQNCSISYGLRKFSSSELLYKEEKYFCQNCKCLQEAKKSMRIKRIPRVVILHIQRFNNVLKKLPYRVVFPFQIKLSNTTDDALDRDQEYNLFGIVVHQGSSVNQGHYISIIKSYNRWIIFDDHNVQLVDESFIQRIYGQSQENNGNNGNSLGHGYILFYMKDGEEQEQIVQQQQQHQNDKFQK